MTTIFNEASRATMAEVRPVKDRSEKRAGGLIENWRIMPFMNNPDSLVITGTLLNDSYWGSHGPIRTSLILSINDDETEAETLNTIYQLGKKAE